MRRMSFAASTALAAAPALGQTAPEPGSIRGRISHPLRQLTSWHEALESGPRQVVVDQGKIVPVAWLDPKRK